MLTILVLISFVCARRLIRLRSASDSCVFVVLVYFAGGWAEGENLPWSSVDVFDLIKRTWTTKEMSVYRSDFSGTTAILFFALTPN